MTENPQAGRLVVGVDGSAPSQAALRWALEQSRLTGTPITAVIAWQYPPDYGLGAVPEGWSPDQDAANALERTLQEVCGDDRPADLRSVVREGNPARVLLDESQGAAMLLVGSRGHGGFYGLLLGSVSAACAERASCPVLVLHAEEPDS